MSLKRNVISSYASQLFMALLGLVMLPVYIHYLGIEAYGLIGVFLLLQNLMQLLDLGFSTTLMRQAAHYRAGALSGEDLHRLVAALRRLLLLFALLVTGGMAVGSGWLARHWLSVERLSLETVVTALLLMAPALGMRLLAGLYRGLIGGFEAIVWLSGFNTAVSIARFLAIIPLFELVGATTTNFFLLQLAVGAGELAILGWKGGRLVPQQTPASGSAAVDTLRPHLRFSLAAGFTSAVWVLVTQVDKLLLSALLPLSAYGLFTTATLAAGGLLMISTPIGSALVPRLTHLHASGETTELSRLYRASTQLIASLAFPAALIMILFPRELLLAWTGRPEIATGAAPILALYAAGNALLAINAFGAYLQFAAGKIRLHVMGNAVFLTLLLPSLVFLVGRLGAIGAGVTWLALNAAWFLVLMPLIHRSFLPGQHLKWLAADVIWPLVPALAVGLAARAAPFAEQRLHAVAQLAGYGLAMAAAATLTTRSFRGRLLGVLPSKQKRLSWR